MNQVWYYNIAVIENFYPPPVQSRSFILQDARERDRVTARRALLTEFIWRERYLTREGLRLRIEMLMGKESFGTSAWKDVFFRDMRVVREAFKAAGYQLRYSRRPGQCGYYLEGEPALAPEIATALRSCVADIDPKQIRIFRNMSVAERFRLGFSVSEAARQVANRR